MTVNELCRRLDARLTAGANGADRSVQTGYICDLLSFVIGKAPEDCAWVTVIDNVHTIAVATLADVACVILAENIPLDEAAQKRADENGVAVLQSEKSAYALAAEINAALGI